MKDYSTSPETVKTDDLSTDLSYPGWEKDLQEAEGARLSGNKWRSKRISEKMFKKQDISNGDRSHPQLKALEALDLTYPGWEDDLQSLTDFHFKFDGQIFWDKLEGLKNKQLSFIEDRTHPNLLNLDSLNVTYNGWKEDYAKAEEAHYDGNQRRFERLIYRIEKKQCVHLGVRSHPQLVALDRLDLTYPGWVKDIRDAEMTHFEFEGKAFFDKLEGLKRKQQKFLGDRSHPNLRKLDLMQSQLTYTGWNIDFKKAENIHLSGNDWRFKNQVDMMQKKEKKHTEVVIDSNVNLSLKSFRRNQLHRCKSMSNVWQKEVTKQEERKNQVEKKTSLTCTSSSPIQRCSSLPNNLASKRRSKTKYEHGLCQENERRRNSIMQDVASKSPRRQKPKNLSICSSTLSLGPSIQLRTNKARPALIKSQSEKMLRLSRGSQVLKKEIMSNSKQQYLPDQLNKKNQSKNMKTNISSASLRCNLVKMRSLSKIKCKPDDSSISNSSLNTSISVPSMSKQYKEDQIVRQNGRASSKTMKIQSSSKQQYLVDQLNKKNLAKNMKMNTSSTSLRCNLVKMRSLSKIKCKPDDLSILSGTLTTSNSMPSMSQQYKKIR